MVLRKELGQLFFPNNPYGSCLWGPQAPGALEVETSHHKITRVYFNNLEPQVLRGLFSKD